MQGGGGSEDNHLFAAEALYNQACFHVFIKRLQEYRFSVWQLPTESTLLKNNYAFAQAIKEMRGTFSSVSTCVLNYRKPLVLASYFDSRNFRRRLAIQRFM